MYSSYSYSPEHLKRIEQTLESAMMAHKRLSCFFITLRFPHRDISRDDNKVISRFTDALKYHINSYIDLKRSEGKRVHATAFYYIWAKEFGTINGNKHYHINLLLNKDTFHRLGGYEYSSAEIDSLANMIQKAWCSAAGLNPSIHSSMIHFAKDLPCMWIENDNIEQKIKVQNRINYLAKNETKDNDSNNRSFHCNQTKPSWLNGNKRI